VKGFGFDLVLVEPGLIKSGFSDVAVTGMKGAESAPVYEEFHEAVARLTKESYEKGPLAKLTGTPDDVAEGSRGRSAPTGRAGATR
jgi:hypothetical protein